MISRCHVWPPLLALLLLFYSPLYAREKTDVVVMRNGDRLTCEIKGLDLGVLYISLDYVDGTISVDWSKVAQLESTQLFIVKDENGGVYTGALRTVNGSASSPVTIQVAEPARKAVELGAKRVVIMGQTSESFWQRFNGETNLGIIFSKGNDSTQFNVGSETEYLRERWLAHAYYNGSVAASSGATASTRNQVDFDSLRLLHRNNYFYAGLASFLQSSVQSIDLQTTLGAGIGRYLRNTNHSRISLIGGLAWQDTDYDRRIVSTGRQNLAAAVIATDVRFFQFSKMNLRVTSTLFPAISAGDLGRVRFKTNASYYIELTRDLSWTFSFYGNWDNRPPAGVSGSDYGTSSGLSWTYGYK